MGAHPAREHVAGQLMRALYAAGRQAEALEVYQRARSYLRGELGLEPSPELRAIQADVRARAGLSEASQHPVRCALSMVGLRGRPRGSRLPRPPGV